MIKIRKLELKLIQFEKTAKDHISSIFEAEVRKLAKAGFSFSRLQFKTRPRLRLIAKLLPVLALVFLASHSAVSYLKPREAEIKINGQQVIAAPLAPSQNVDEVEINQEVGFKRSPFEFEMPVAHGYVSQGYRSYHRAQDIATDLGSPIHPVGAGIVDFAGYTADGKGNIVVVDHGDGLKSLYAHMGRINVGVGNMVNANSNLGTVGLTGHTTGPHVHLEIYDNDVTVDPGNLLPPAN